jgi:hypothetical protein
MPKRIAHTCIRDQTIVQVQVRPADAGTRYPYDGILGMLNLRHRLLVDTDP